MNIIKQNKENLQKEVVKGTKIFLKKKKKKAEKGLGQI